MAIHLRILSWALIFIVRLRFPPAKSIAKSMSIHSSKLNCILHCPKICGNVEEADKEHRRFQIVIVSENDDKKFTKIVHEYANNVSYLLENFAKAICPDADIYKRDL